MARAQLTDKGWGFVEPYLPVGRYGPSPERLRQQFEGVIWKFRSGAQWREMPDRVGAWSGEGRRRGGGGPEGGGEAA